jgi:Protein of unknown function (DUF1579)
MQTNVSASLASHPPFAGISFEVGQPDRPVQRRSAHERLRACIGDWRASGKLDAGGEMRCLESYSWLPGEFFVEYRFDRDVGDSKHAGVGLIGYDEARDEYFAFSSTTSAMRAHTRCGSKAGPGRSSASGSARPSPSSPRTIV